MTDEDVMEQAFLSALRKHFKKPGPWLPYVKVDANGWWPSAQGIPDGQVWEVYIWLTYGQTAVIQELDPARSGFIAANASETWEAWFPLSSGSIAWVFDKIDPATGALTLAGGSPVKDIGMISTAPEGWILTQGDRIAGDDPLGFYVRVRRRFDLET